MADKELLQVARSINSSLEADRLSSRWNKWSIDFIKRKFGEEAYEIARKCGLRDLWAEKMEVMKVTTDGDLVGLFTIDNLNVSFVTGQASWKVANGDRVIISRSERNLFLSVLDGVTPVPTIDETIAGKLAESGFIGPGDTLLPQIAAEYPPFIFDSDYLLKIMGTTYNPTLFYGDIQRYIQHPDYSSLERIISGCKPEILPWVNLNALTGWLMGEKMLGLEGVKNQQLPAVTGAMIGIINESSNKDKYLRVSAIADTRVYLIQEIESDLWIKEISSPDNYPHDRKSMQKIREIMKKQKKTKVQAREYLIETGYFEESYRIKRNTMGGTPVCDGTSQFFNRENISNIEGGSYSRRLDPSILGVVVLGDGAVAHLQTQNGLDRRGVKSLIKRVIQGDNIESLVSEIRGIQDKMDTSTKLEKPDDITVASILRSDAVDKIKKKGLYWLR